jgi:hypothetical protein
MKKFLRGACPPPLHPIRTSETGTAVTEACFGTWSDGGSTMSEARKNTDHAEIRKWAEARGAVPTVVQGTEGGKGGGVLRFEFVDHKSLKEIDWETFLKTFDSRHRAPLAQDEIDGKTSRFFKFVER